MEPKCVKKLNEFISLFAIAIALGPDVATGRGPTFTCLLKIQQNPTSFIFFYLKFNN